ncbi:hypothetical protein NDU88_005338 [Pleurodeles waltl]|uniref:Uncharacterized protein n=1 Tax=Pleurodeles waltl TaxID=8319 RepID=A0AAV7TWB5_PLEWA|nr:hypothetical protein NDU88_005338 [Pleurodeles waltl]
MSFALAVEDLRSDPPSQLKKEELVGPAERMQPPAGQPWDEPLFVGAGGWGLPRSVPCSWRCKGTIGLPHLLCISPLVKTLYRLWRGRLHWRTEALCPELVPCAQLTCLGRMLSAPA